MTKQVEIPGYRIDRQIGVGGMASVYLAQQMSLGRPVALKVMHLAQLADQVALRRFVKEGKTLAKLVHPHIITVYDIGTTDRYCYLAMEYLDGGDLKDRIEWGLSTADALKAADAIARALSFAHREGFIHRDVKPHNVLFRADDTPLLTDFGIAKAIDSTTRLTAEGYTVGSAGYMSPEQSLGQELDERADLYSFGVLLWEMLTGRVPYLADDSYALAMLHATSPIPRLPASLAVYQPLIDRLLAKQPQQRYPSAEAFLRDLRAIEPGPDVTTGLTEETMIRSWPSEESVATQPSFDAPDGKPAGGPVGEPAGEPVGEPAGEPVGRPVTVAAPADGSGQADVHRNAAEGVGVYRNAAVGADAGVGVYRRTPAPAAADGGVGVNAGVNADAEAEADDGVTVVVARPAPDPAPAVDADRDDRDLIRDAGRAAGDAGIGAGVARRAEPEVDDGVERSGWGWLIAGAVALLVALGAVLWGPGPSDSPSVATAVLGSDSRGAGSADRPAVDHSAVSGTVTEAVGEIGPATDPAAVSVDVGPGKTAAGTATAPVRADPARHDLAQLLALGAQRWRDGRYLRPAGDSAFAYYRQALQHDPLNDEAHQRLLAIGRQTLLPRYRALAARHCAAGVSVECQRHLAVGLALQPDDPELLRLRARLTAGD